MSTVPEQGRGPFRRWAVLFAVLAMVAVACLVVAVQAAQPSGLRGTVVDPASAGSVTSDDSSEVPPTAPPPVGLRIPAIDVTADITRLGLNPDRTVEVPSDPADTGWYRLGPTPGQPGSAVILGHVDSDEGPAVFHRLRQLERGDLVIVDAADGSSSTFRVTRLATYPNEAFPAQEVYAAPGRGRVLNLVTCGGRYDPEDGYQSNVVAYTRWVRDPPR